MESLRARLDEARGRWPAIAEDTGVDYATVARIARGDTPHPRIDTVERLERWLADNYNKAA